MIKKYGGLIMSKVLFIVGSLRQGSFNNQLAQETEKALAGKADVSYLDWSQVPIFSQDLEQSTPSAVAKVREEVQAQTLSGFSHRFTTSLFLVQ